MERITIKETRRRASWGSIIGGVVTVLAVSIFLAILGGSISLFMLEPTAHEPASGIGTTIGIWTVVSLLLSLAAGGFVAGKLAGADGVIHGFLVWATSMIVTIILGGMLAAGAVRATANVLGSVASVTGDVVSGVGSAVENGVSALSDEAENLFGSLDFDADRNQIRNDVRQALRRSGVRELQPAYLQNQLQAVEDDLNRSVKRLAANPQQADAVIDGFLGRLQNRVQVFSQKIDKDDIVRLVAANTNMTRAQAEDTVDQYMELVEQGRQQLEDLQQTIQEARQEWDNIKQRALVEAEKATNAAARAALWAFIALLVGGAVACLLGAFGAKKTQQGYEV